MSDAWLQFIPFVFWVVITIIPSVKLLRRTGMHPALAALNLFPLLGAIIILWVVAYARWPKTESA